MEAKAAVGAEYHDGFAQIVERGFLDVDQAVELGLEREFVGDVLEQDKRAAERVTLARDAQDAAVGQVPEVLDDVDLFALIIGEFAFAPFGEVWTGRQLAAFTQAVE